MMVVAVDNDDLLEGQRKMTAAPGTLATGLRSANPEPAILRKDGKC